MKTPTVIKPGSRPQSGTYSSIEELVNEKVKRASQTLKNVDLTKIKNSKL